MVGELCGIKKLGGMNGIKYLSWWETGRKIETLYLPYFPTKWVLGQIYFTLHKNSILNSSCPMSHWKYWGIPFSLGFLSRRSRIVASWKINHHGGVFDGDINGGIWTDGLSQEKKLYSILELCCLALIKSRHHLKKKIPILVQYHIQQNRVFHFFQWRSDVRHILIHHSWST